MRFIRPALLFPLIASAAVALSGCDLFGERGPVKIAAIGPLNLSATPLSGELSAANAALLAAPSQGLVSSDGEGQIDTGLAHRWTGRTSGGNQFFPPHNTQRD